jgi:predicted transcriptional regulator
MRTTIDLADHLLLRAKQLAAAERTTLTAILEDSLRAYLAATPSRRQRKAGRTQLPTADGGKPNAAMDLNDTSALWEIQ